jgi:hypothetical protein
MVNAMAQHLTYLRPEDVSVLWDFCTLEILSRVQLAALERVGPIIGLNKDGCLSNSGRDVGLRRIGIELHRTIALKLVLAEKLGLTPSSYQQLKINMPRAAEYLDLEGYRQPDSDQSDAATETGQAASENGKPHPARLPALEAS